MDVFKTFAQRHLQDTAEPVSRKRFGSVNAEETIDCEKIKATVI
jgi:hypothetical protein